MKLSEKLLATSMALEISLERLTAAQREHQDVLDVEVKAAITDGLAACSRGLRILDPYIGRAVREEQRV